MPDYNNEISTSGPVNPQQFHSTDHFTDYTELPSKGYCRVVKTQRYGVWNVLKGLKPSYASNKYYQEMLAKEFAIMIGLNHPNIVRTYGHEKIPELGECIVMEYIDGRTLEDFISEKPSMIQRRQVVYELLDALAYFHKKQIVHQDLKPSNILITHDGNHVKIIDFGLSDSREYAILKGPAYTKAYAAPEQLSGEEVDNRTDIYAFGLILKQLFPKHHTQIVKKCLQPQREKRYSSSEAILEEIKRQEIKRKWLPGAASALLLLLGLTTTLVYLYYQKSEKSEKMPDMHIVSEKDQDTQVEAPHKAEEKIVTNHTSYIKSNGTPVQQNISSTDDAQEMLELYMHHLKFEYDSILRPFDKDLKEGSIRYIERFTYHKTIAFYKIWIHTQQRRHQLPKNKQTLFLQYANDLWNRLFARYLTADKNGDDLYPSYIRLHNEGKISDEEYEQLCEETKKDNNEIKRLNYLLNEETAKD